MNLPTDIYRHLFSLTRFRLHDIIMLTMVSKKLRQMALLEENWYTISDTEQILIKFVYHMLQSKSWISHIYPLNKIQQMCTTDYRDKFIFDGLDYPALFEINGYITPQFDLSKFYKCFTDYQYLYVDRDRRGQLIKSLRENKLFRGICNSNYESPFDNFEDCFPYTKIIQNNITEIIVSHQTISCRTILKFYPRLEKLTVCNLGHIEQLKRTSLKYLHANRSPHYRKIIKYLPKTIESLTIDTDRSLLLCFDQLKLLPNLNYLKLNYAPRIISTSLRIKTLHLVIDILDGYRDVQIGIPNVANIIIECRYNEPTIEKFSMMSQNAITCQLFNIPVANPSLILPNCSKIIIRGNKANIPKVDTFSVLYDGFMALTQWIRQKID
jgi:hypothetical protein